MDSFEIPDFLGPPLRRLPETVQPGARSATTPERPGAENRVKLRVLGRASGRF